MRQCLFCENVANSREHLWPLWILEGLKKTKETIRQNRGNEPARFLHTAEIQIRCVCDVCNNGWMSDLESTSRPIIGSLMRDISTPLDAEQQLVIALWALKTSMVLERSKPRDRRHCYATRQCQELRLSLSIPARTSVRIGRLSHSVLHANAADFDLKEIAGHGVLTNIIVGHLVIQVVTVNISSAYAGKPLSILAPGGQWERYATPIWPTQNTVNWPPEATLKLHGEPAIGGFLNRYRPLQP